MTSAPSRLRRAAVLVAAVPLLFIVSACDSGSAPAAEVNGHDVGGSRFVKGAELFSELASGAGAAQADTGTGSVDTASAAAYLRVLILSEAFRVELDHRGAKVTSADRDQARASLVEQFPGHRAGQGQTAARKFDAYPKWFQETLVDFQARAGKLTSEVKADPELARKARAAYEANKETQFASWCVDALVDRTAEAAAADRARVVGGEDFATVATDLAKSDPQLAVGDKSDGDAGCDTPTNWASRLGPAVSDTLGKLAVGEISEPLQLQQGAYVVLRLRSKGVQAFEEVQPQILDSLGEDALNRVIAARIAKLDVEVNPRYGHWTDKGGAFQVVPPEGPEKPTTATTNPLPLVAPQG